MDAPTAITVAGAAVAGLGSVVWWLIRFTHSRVDEERKEREEDRHNLRNEISIVAVKLQAHELHVAREYVNHDRLAMALKPIEDGVARVEGTLERLFGELKGKEDRHLGHRG